MPAQGRTIVNRQEAVWRANVSGTFTSTGTVTNNRCERYDAEDRVTYFTASGNASESSGFRTARGVALYVTKYYGRAPTAMSDRGRPMLVDVVRTLQSSLDSNIDPRGCKPSSGFSTTPDCGTKSLRQPVFVSATNERRWQGLQFRYEREARPFAFQQCPRVDKQDELPLSYYQTSSTPGTGWGAIAPRRLFGRSRTLTIPGSRKWTTRAGGQGFSYSATATHEIKWTLTLRRVRVKTLLCSSTTGRCRTVRS